VVLESRGAAKVKTVAETPPLEPGSLAIIARADLARIRDLAKARGFLTELEALNIEVRPFATHPEA
jgi:hypothetical protein